MNKKLEFDLKMLGPKQTLINTIQEAGYTYRCDVYVGDITCGLHTQELATCKEQIDVFIQRIAYALGKECNIDFQDGLFYYWSEDHKFGGNLCIGCNFELVYDEHGELFTDG